MPVRQGHRSGLASRLRLSGVLILVSGWVLLSIRLLDPPRFSVSLLFQFFTYKEGFSFAFCGGRQPLSWVVSLLFSASYPQDRRSYYLFLYYLFFTTCMVYLYRRKWLPRVYLYRRKWLPRVYLYRRGKLPRITQACGNKRFALSWRFGKWRWFRSPNRPVEASDGPLRGREWGD